MKTKKINDLEINYIEQGNGEIEILDVYYNDEHLGLTPFLFEKANLKDLQRLLEMNEYL